MPTILPPGPDASSNGLPVSAASAVSHSMPVFISDLLLLVCHAAEGYLTDGNRAAVNRTLDRSGCITAIDRAASGWYTVHCTDGGRLRLHAPGLIGAGAFHRILVGLDAGRLSRAGVAVLYDLMHDGGFGLLASLDAPRLVVTRRRQVLTFPWLPEPPLLVTNAAELGAALGITLAAPQVRAS